MTVFEMANKYYNCTPRLWDEKRIKALLDAKKITKEEYDKIINNK